MIIDQFIELFTGDSGYYYLLLRSLAVSLIILVGQLAVSITTGFLLGRFRFKLRVFLLIMYTVVLFLPYSATLLPNYLVISKLRLLDTQLSLILPAIFSPLGVIIITIFMSGVTAQTIDAALLETNSAVTIIGKIILPQIRPGVALTAIITFSEAWNMVEQPQAMMDDRLKRPLSLLLNSIFRSSAAENIAGVLLFIIPPLILLYSFRVELTKLLLVERKAKNKISAPSRAIAGMLIVCMLLTAVSAFIYKAVTPSAYAILPAKAKLGENLYSCVIPTAAVSSDNKIYVAVPRKTVMGISYTAYEFDVEIEYSDGVSTAIEWGPENKDKVIILACEREIKSGDNVIIVLNSDPSDGKAIIKINDENEISEICLLLDALRIPYSTAECDGGYQIETRADLTDIVKSICHANNTVVIE